MNIRKFLRNILAVGTAAASSIFLSGSPIYADTPHWNIDPGGLITADSTNPYFSQVTVKCDASVVDTAEVFDDTVHGPTHDLIGYIYHTTWIDCMTPFGLAIISHLGSWELWINHSQSGGGLSGEIRNFEVRISVTACTITLKGAARWTYSGKVLRVAEPLGGNLVATSSSGCSVTGMRPGFTGDYTVNPATTITEISPH